MLYNMHGVQLQPTMPGASRTSVQWWSHMSLSSSSVPQL